jgi:subtilase family serine protease
LHNPASGKFHQWLTPSQFGAQFGPAASDIAQITGWLQGHGFRVNTIYPSGMTIDFSGTAGQVRTAFHTEIHHLQVNGVGHIANMSDPQIPAAFAPAVVGIVSLHDFMPRPTLVRKLTTEYTIANCSTSAPTTCYAVTPPDLATIYNFNPLFQAGTSGQNQTIYLIEDTDLYTTSDWTTFRSTFGLSAYTSGSLSTIHPAPPSGSNNCADPGVNSDDIEAILDAEYASAAAPNARIVLATCADTNTTFGALFAIQNLINGANPPAIISLSYIECEAANGASSNAAFSAIYQQGVAEGTSIFVAAGDEDAGSCDYNGTAVTHGIGVNAYASTPYNVAVGGTDFSDTYSATNSTYWSPSNTSTYGSAKSYVPEIPWNDSCAGQLLATFEQYTTTYGSSGFCNSRKGAGFLNNGGGSGGPSGCATGSPSPSTPEVVSGSCAGYAKPSWQSGVVGIPNDGVRDIPDVSLFAADGLWGHY